MSENISEPEFFAVFTRFETSLSSEQRLLLLQHPQIIHPELRPAFFQSSLDRMASTQLGTDFGGMPNATIVNKKVEARKPRKVVNSWMAFRTYYSSLMKDLPQKGRSPILSALWKSDVDHGLWELLSAAFSYIRDNHSEDNVSLDQFLDIATQIVPVIPADQYLKRAGWNRNGNAVVPIANHRKQSPHVTNYSCAGVARYCFRAGLISKPPTTKEADFRPMQSRQTPPSTIAFAAMATAPLMALATSPVQPVTVAQEAQATDDIELKDDKAADDAVTESKSASAGTPCTMASSSLEVETMPAGQVAAVDSPYETVITFANMDMQDIFDSSVFSLDAYWDFRN